MRNSSGYFRIFEPLIRELLDRGHRVHIALDRRDRQEGDRWLENLASEWPSLTFKTHRAFRDSHWHAFTRNLRLTRDYVEFLRPSFRAAPELVLRAERRAPAVVQRVMAHQTLRGPQFTSLASKLLRVAEAAVPVFGPARRLISHYKPDVVLLAPHLMPGSLHTMHIRAAQSLGLRSAVCVASWDNLSSKQLLRVEPDAVIVWNETQKREAIDLHGVAPERVVITGAQCYDHWFSWRPRPRKEFAELVGLDPEKPFVAYVGGSLFPAEMTEADFAMRWIEALRSATDPSLRDLGVLVRPHPKRGEEWGAVDFSRFGGVSLWPEGGRVPVEDDAKADFFDTIYHSAAVVGVNTSAMIEAGIIGRTVLTILLPEFAGSQEGVFHFRYLLETGGGLLVAAPSLDEHLVQLARAVRGEDDGEARRRNFLEAFVRPHGLDVAATPVFTDEVERLANLGPRPPLRVPARLLPLTALFAPVALVMDRRERRRSRLKKQAAEARRLTAR